MCIRDRINHTQHNLYTLRGAEVRNGLKWAKYIDESLQLFGEEVEISFGGHHWPTWGKEDIQELWTKQRDVYKFIHDQTLYLANNGYTMLEIAEVIQLPKSLSSYFANRSYYGTLSHNAKKVCNEANYASAKDGLLLESIEQEAIKGTKNQIEAVMAAMQKRAANFEDYRDK